MDVIFGLVRWVVIIALLGVVLFRIFRTFKNIKRTSRRTTFWGNEKIRRKW